MNSQVRSFADLRSTDGFKIELAKQEFALEIRRAMAREEVTNAVLAERLGVSRPMVTKLLRGDANVTIETMVKAALAVGGQLFLKILRGGSSARFFEVAQALSHKQVAEGRCHVNRAMAMPTTSAWDFAANEEENENEPVAA
ncbi:helix-turn-helix domain-containing protein [Stenotrophomonas maltophilia]|nr:helix-turn-helix domain-containing protein [Stenotrophomonas maltophilia]